jgi:restriction system protein
MTFTDAAETVLDQQKTHAPMHYQQITELALAQGLLNTQGQTPEATLYAQVLTEIKRQALKGQTPRFTKHGQGLVGLTKWLGSGLLAQITQHNAGVAKELHARLMVMTPTEFEVLVGTLLDRMGFAVTVTKPTSDGGVDVRGTLAVGGTMGVNMAVQVKRWKHNVSSPEVQKLRGSLMVHEQGLLVTTSGFSSGAKSEASKPNAIPVGLIDGKELVALLMRHQIGVRELPTPLYELESDTEPRR